MGRTGRSCEAEAKVSNLEAKWIIEQILKAISYLYSRAIVVFIKFIWWRRQIKYMTEAGRHIKMLSRPEHGCNRRIV